INIRPRISGRTDELFGAGERGHSNEPSMSEIGFAYSIRDFGETKIDDFDFQLYCLSIGPSDHDIARLQIAVDQTLGRRRNQRPRHLDRNFQSLLYLERTLSPNKGFQGFALNQLHRV